jgi:diaminohydroxyphosphoribosylaminopyrimidine deaminase/5-amino-6-(5-phosphoribosylamino)uracil reductase
MTKKGSICIDGISLTISDLYLDYFTINIIPHTYINTIIKYYNINDKVNLEFDHYTKKPNNNEIMNIAIKISEKYKGYTYPNPHVGCVIINSNYEIVSCGSHEEYGNEHAEINALNKFDEYLDKNLENISNDKYKIFITLEPCSHIGKTESCAAKILKYSFEEINIGILDPNPIVKGNGIKILKNKFNVNTGILKDEIENSLKEYIYYYENQRPFITGKISTTINGVFKSNNKKRLIVSNEDSFNDVHKFRSMCDAILIGYNTYIYDEPKLTVRYNYKQNPRYKKFILLNNHINNNYIKNKIANEKNDFIFVNINEINEINETNKINEINKYLNIISFKTINEFLQYLYKINIIHLNIEGGNKTINKFQKKMNELINYIHPYNLDGVFFDFNYDNYYIFNVYNKPNYIKVIFVQK